MTKITTSEENKLARFAAEHLASDTKSSPVTALSSIASQMEHNAAEQAAEIRVLQRELSRAESRLSSAFFLGAAFGAFLAWGLL